MTLEGIAVNTTSVESDTQIETIVPNITEVERIFKFRVKA